MRAAAVFGGVDVSNPLINVEGIGIQDGTRADMEAAIAYAHSLGVGIFAMKPLGGGHLIADNARALRYLLDAPWADSIAVGMQSEKEIDANAAWPGETKARCGSFPIGSAILSCRIIAKAVGNAWNFAARARCPSGTGMPWWTRTSACCAAIARRVCPQFAVKVI